MAIADFLTTRSPLVGEQRSLLKVLLARLSNQQAQGHNCLLLSEAERDLIAQSNLVTELSNEPLSALLPAIRPLVLEQHRLYLQRYWAYETRLAWQLVNKIKLTHAFTDIDSALDRYFPPLPNNETDWQRAAAKMALQQVFSIITGGPGTGKTTTVVKILALMQELTETPLHIALAAPTGKAAMRLQESIGQSINRLPCTQAIKQSIPDKVTTLHRLLGARANSPYFRHDATHPLVYDLIVIDEASMVDLALMSKLVDALKASGRLILLGDKDQLASVESGSVLADLTEALPAQTLELKVSHRFDHDIKALAEAINSQRAEQAWQLLQQQNNTVGILNGDPIHYVAEQQHAYLRLIKQGASFQEIYRSFSGFQVLCATRQGTNSVTDLNYRVEQQLARENLITLSGLWYAGRPVMITQNNPTLHLYNGDIGICLPDTDNANKLRVFFQQADGMVKKYLPARITHCETVFAMTIHKSQGSEFDEVLVVLPELMNPVLTKELLYTALTRAKKSLKVVAEEPIFKATTLQKIQRVTGLVNKLKQD